MPIYHDPADRYLSRCRADSAPIDEQWWLNTGYLRDTDGIDYIGINGQPITDGIHVIDRPDMPAHETR